MRGSTKPNTKIIPKPNRLKLMKITSLKAAPLEAL